MPYSLFSLFSSVDSEILLYCSTRLKTPEPNLRLTTLATKVLSSLYLKLHKYFFLVYKTIRDVVAQTWSLKKSMCNQSHSLANYTLYNGTCLITQDQNPNGAGDQADILFIKVEGDANYPELDSGLLDQLGPPSHNSHLYPTPPKVTGIVDTEERLEPPSPPFAQGRISSRIRAMFSGDHAAPKVPATLHWVTHRGSITATSNSVVPYLEPHGPTKKKYPNNKHLAPITPPTNRNHGRRYPWEPKRRPPLSPVPEIENFVQAPPIKFPQFQLSSWEEEDHVSNGLDLYDPVSSHFGDDESYFHSQDDVGIRGSQDGLSTSLSHKRSGLVHTIAARKQYPEVVKISHIPPGDGQIVKEDILSGSVGSPTRNPPVPQTGPQVDKATDSWLSDGEESETEDLPDTPRSSMSQEEVDGGLSYESRLEVQTRPRRRKRHKIDPDIRLQRGSTLLPPAIHLPANETSLDTVKVVSPLFGPGAVTSAALLLGTGKDVRQTDSVEVMPNRPAVHYRNLATAGDKSFTWREGVRPVASRPLKDTENIQEKSTNDSNEPKYNDRESKKFDLVPSSRYLSDNDKLSAAYSKMELRSPRASIETVEDTHIDSPSTVITQPRSQIPLVCGHWIPNRGCPPTTIPTAPSPHRKILKSLATLTASKSAPQSSQYIPVGGASIYKSSREPPEIPKDAGTCSFRIKGAGPWLAKHLPQKKPANPFRLEVPVREVKKAQVPDPDENFEKFLQARAEVEEASHHPSRRRAKHLGGIWERKRDC